MCVARRTIIIIIKFGIFIWYLYIVCAASIGFLFLRRHNDIRVVRVHVNRTNVSYYLYGPDRRTAWRTFLWWSAYRGNRIFVTRASRLKFENIRSTIRFGDLCIPRRGKEKRCHCSPAERLPVRFLERITHQYAHTTCVATTLNKLLSFYHRVVQNDNISINDFSNILLRTRVTAYD